MSESRIFASTELVGAMATSMMDKEQVKAFTSDPVIVAASFDIDISNFEVSVIENSAKDVNLTLPYYESIESVRSEVLQDEKLANVAGGEIIISIAAIIGGCIGAAIGGTVGIGVGAAIGGVTAGVVTACVVGGTVAHIVENDIGNDK